jgi:hypothetical protein
MSIAFGVDIVSSPSTRTVSDCDCRVASSLFLVSSRCIAPLSCNSDREEDDSSVLDPSVLDFAPEEDLVSSLLDSRLEEDAVLLDSLSGSLCVSSVRDDSVLDASVLDN